MLDRRGGRSWLALTLAALSLAAPALLSAQDADFLFRRPVATVSLYGGWAMPGEDSDVFDFTREHLTVDQGAFQSPLVLAELGVRATDRLDVTVGLEHASRTVDSEMEEWVTLDDQPIRQQTRFSRTRLLAGAKLYLLPRGRQISDYAWIPARGAPYVGGGVGYAWYDFVQDGDFVNFDTADIFEAELEATGSGQAAYALAGLQWTLTPRFLLRAEYRYLWGSGSLEGASFGSDFDDVDLSGSRALVGVSVRL